MVIIGLPGKCPLELCIVAVLVIKSIVASGTCSRWASPTCTRMVGASTVEEKCLMVTASKRCSLKEEWMLTYNVQ